MTVPSTCEELISQYGDLIRKYDTNGDLKIDRNESVKAVDDYFNFKITKDESIAVVNFYMNNCTLPVIRGTLSMNSVPAGAFIFLERSTGLKYISGDLNTPLNMDVSPALYNLTFKKYGYEDWTQQNIQIIGGQTTTINANMVAIPVPTVTPTVTPIPPTVTPVIPTVTPIPPTVTPQPSGTVQDVVNWYLYRIPSCDKWGYIHTTIQQAASEVGYTGDIGTAETAARNAYTEVPCVIPTVTPVIPTVTPVIPTVTPVPTEIPTVTPIPTEIPTVSPTHYPTVTPTTILPTITPTTPLSSSGQSIVIILLLAAAAYLVFFVKLK